MKRWPFILFACLLSASVVSIGLLGRTVVADLRVSSISKTDDVSWRMSQLEVELLRFQSAVRDAVATSDSTLATLRKRYDIFYSRIDTLQHSAFNQFLTGNATATDALAKAGSFLEQTTPLIDSDDATLRDALPQIYADSVALDPTLRRLALTGVDVFTKQERLRRATFSDALQNAALGLICLISVLFVALAFLIKLYRQGQRISQASEIARARFEAAVSSSLDAVLVVDTAGHIIEFNGAAETVFGYTREEALGADMADLIVPEHMRDAHRNGMQRFIDTGDRKVIGAGRVRLEGLRKSGEIFPVELSISLSEASGETVFVSFLRDIKEELQAEEDLREALEKAQVGEKAKSNLLTVMSHEMRTPLNGILGSLDLIDQDNLTNNQKRHLNSIAVSGELLLSHVNDVLDLSALSSDTQKTEMSVFDVKELVSSVADSLQANADARGNSVSVNFLSTDIGAVRGHRTSLQRCLVNLVGNAIKFTQDGSVSIEVERLPEDDMVEFRVSDSGVGIAPENLDRIFEEFVTIDTAFDRQNSGTGLGLAITKRLIEQGGGKIEADSILGEGSLFIVRLPLPPVRIEGPLSPPPADTELPNLPAGFRALLVDDNDINLQILTDILQELGSRTVEATNGFDAIDLANEQEFDVYMLDISMPGIDGIETLRRIRRDTGQDTPIPAVAVTAHAAPKDHKKILEAGFDSLLVKPLNRVSVHQCLAQVLGVFEGGEHPAQESEASEFLQRFGEERFRAALKETALETQELLNALERAAGLTEAQREEAHRLSGSAAILGQHKMWAALQRVQNAPSDDWPGLRSDLVEAVQTQLHAMNDKVHGPST